MNDNRIQSEFNLWVLFLALSRAIGQRECIIWRNRRLPYSVVAEEASLLARGLLERGLTLRTERSQLRNHESGQAAIALLLCNGPEYVVAMLGAFAARAVSFNVNHRYTENELRDLLIDSGAECIIFHSRFASMVSAVRPLVPRLRHLIQVPDDSGISALPGSESYHEVMTTSGIGLESVYHSPDDLYLLYTGGTTGAPKGVLWRQHDIFVAAMGGRSIATGEESADIDSIVERAKKRRSFPVLVPSPLMHGAAQWACFIAMCGGGTVVFPDTVTRIEPMEIWALIEVEQIKSMMVVGEAMFRPMVDALERRSSDLSSLVAISNAGAQLTSRTWQRFQTFAPETMLVDTVGASESGTQLIARSYRDNSDSGRDDRRKFQPGKFTRVLDEALSAEALPGHNDLGWLANRGNVPLGYLGDQAKTDSTFRTIGGVRYSVPGDRARLLADGSVELLGRDSSVVNSGGEKIFVEEVERAIARHGSVVDTVVTGHLSERWGQEVVAIVELAQDAEVTDEELLQEAGRTLARYKLPKRIVFVRQIERQPSGKADYRWASNYARAVLGD